MVKGSAIIRHEMAESGLESSIDAAYPVLFLSTALHRTGVSKSLPTQGV